MCRDVEGKIGLSIRKSTNSEEEGLREKERKKV